MTKKSIDTQKASGMCLHGNFPSKCSACLAEQEGKIEQEKTERKKEIQMQIVREWGEKQEPSLIEGEDFIFIADILSVIEEGESIAPHEMANLYFGYLKEHFHKMKEFFETQYIDEMNKVRDKEPEIFSPWVKRETTLNYSWAGRYMVEQAAGGVPIDSVPIDSLDTGPAAETHHERFKDFFMEETGFEFPTSKELDEVLVEMRESLPWYQMALQLTQEKRGKIEQMSPAEQDKIDWDNLPNIYQMQYAIIILENAHNPEKWKNGAYFDELPEEVDSSESENIRHYADFTYNADDWFDLQLVAEFIGDELESGGFSRLPNERGRIDRIFALVGDLREDSVMQQFDRNKLEDIERQFSEQLYPAQ
ncbi:MAG: hypothetical protein ABH846_01000 [Patescibacteria group bacterium]